MSDDADAAIRSIHVPLSDADVRDRADSLITALNEHDEIEAEKKAAVKVFGERLEKSDEGIKALRLAIENRVEERKVACLAEPDYRAGKMIYLHPETREKLGERDLDQSEYQTELPAGAVPISGPPRAAPAETTADAELAAAEANLTAGTCRFCGCTNDGEPCDLGDGKVCGWWVAAKPEDTVCNKPDCVRQYNAATPVAPRDYEQNLGTPGTPPAPVSNVTPIGAGKKKRGRPPKNAAAPKPAS